MAKKIRINDELYGKMTMSGFDCWKLDNKKCFTINKKEQEVLVEIGILYNTYLRYELDLMPEEIKKIYEANPEKLKKKEAIEAQQQQKELYQKLLIDNIKIIEKNIEEAALRKREEMMEDQTEESFARILGKDKAKRIFAAKTREEKLESLQLKRMRVMQDCVEITCICDWFSPSGGFSIFPDLGVEMLYVDSMSI